MELRATGMYSVNMYACFYTSIYIYYYIYIVCIYIYIPVDRYIYGQIYIDKVYTYYGPETASDKTWSVVWAA